MDLEPALAAALVDPERLDDALDAVPLGFARVAHACTHTTFAPTVVHGGTKTNVIPDRVDLQVDIRTLPGQSAADISAMLDDALGDLAAACTVLKASHDDSTASPIDTPLWDAMGRAARALLSRLDARADDDRRRDRRALLPATRHPVVRLRSVQHASCGTRTTRSMFHGDDERVDVESLRLSTEMWQVLARDFLA